MIEVLVCRKKQPIIGCFLKIPGHSSIISQLAAFGNPMVTSHFVS